MAASVLPVGCGSMTASAEAPRFYAFLLKGMHSDRFIYVHYL